MLYLCKIKIIIFASDIQNLPTKVKINIYIDNNTGGGEHPSMDEQKQMLTSKLRGCLDQVNIAMSKVKVMRVVGLSFNVVLNFSQFKSKKKEFYRHCGAYYG